MTRCSHLPRVGCGADEHVVAGPAHHGAVNYETGQAADANPTNVETRDDFARFLSAVLADFRSTGEDEWENGTLDRFLDALSAFADARVVEAPVLDQEQASWRLFAEIVWAATGYE
jgi:hypothetical protein